MKHRHLRSRAGFSGLCLLSVLGGCAQDPMLEGHTEPKLIDAHMGESVKHVRNAQIYDPAAAAYPAREPVDGLIPDRSKAVYDGYTDPSGVDRETEVGREVFINTDLR